MIQRGYGSQGLKKFIENVSKDAKNYKIYRDKYTEGEKRFHEKLKSLRS